jgi:acyl-CoA thioesterase
MPKTIIHANRQETDPMNTQDVKTLLETKNAFAAHLGIAITEMGEGTATCTMAIRPELANPFGTVNAGAIYGLAETAFGAAANSHGTAALAVNLSIAYVRPATGATLTARAEELSAGRRMATYSVKVYDDAGELVADVQAMGYRTGRDLGELA